MIETSKGEMRGERAVIAAAEGAGRDCQRRYTETRNCKTLRTVLTSTVGR